MRKFKWLALIMLFTGVGQLFAQTNVILISWDGADRSVIAELMKAGTLTNLDAVVKAGSLQEIEVKGHATETLPGHAQMLTGMDSDKTGVKANHDQNPVPKGLSIFEQLKKAPGVGKVDTIMVTGKTKITRMMVNSRESIDESSSGDRAAASTGAAALAALDKHATNRFFAFIHFSDPDFAGHSRGSGSRDYREAVVTCDMWLGRVAAWVKEHKLDDRTLIYVTADHGFDKNAERHTNAPEVWLATNDKEVKHGGTQADVPATVMQRMGIVLEKLDPPLLGKSLCTSK